MTATCVRAWTMKDAAAAATEMRGGDLGRSGKAASGEVVFSRALGVMYRTLKPHTTFQCVGVSTVTSSRCENMVPMGSAALFCDKCLWGNEKLMRIFRVCSKETRTVASA